MAGVAIVAGAEPVVAARLGASMTALQAAIGAMNDLVDAPVDTGRMDKPIATGDVPPRLAAAVAGGSAIVGIGLAVPSGIGLVSLALVVLAIGAAYDLRAKGTAWSWLPFAVGIPLLPVYGWYGAAGSLPIWFAGLVPMGALAGAALAVGNARADLERDRSAGVESVATILGDRTARVLAAALWGVVAVVAIGWLLILGPTVPSLVLVVLGIAVIVGGVVLGWDASGRARDRAWEVQAVGAAIAAIGWVLGVA